MSFQKFELKISMLVSFFFIGSSYSSLYWQVRQHITFNLILHKPSNTDTIYTLAAHCVYVCVCVYERERDHGLSETCLSEAFQYCELMLFDVLTMKMGAAGVCQHMWVYVWVRNTENELSFAFVCSWMEGAECWSRLMF